MTDDKRSNLLDKIRALLSKAESTNFPEEAKAYQAKAQELMTRYAIEEMELSDTKATRDELVHEVMTIVGPYALAKGHILVAVARANRCRVLFPSRLNKGFRFEYHYNPELRRETRTKVRTEDKPAGSGQFYLIGFGSDVDLVKMMFTSLLVQATNEMLDSELDRMAVGVHGQGGVIHGKTWRNSFLKGYASGLTSRLYVANEKAKLDYGPKTGLALIDKEKQVANAADKLSGGKRSDTSSVSAAAYGQGKTAANRADVGNSRLPNQPKAIR